MERIALLTARIALYRRYLNEGADGDVARAYLWQIRRDATELATITEELRSEQRAGTADTIRGVLPVARPRIPKDG